jgi:uncharacterized protein YegJ (DUF2314 family)
MPSSTVSFDFPYQSPLLVACSANCANFLDLMVWDDYVQWAHDITGDEQFARMIDESRPKFLILDAQDRKNAVAQCSERFSAIDLTLLENAKTVASIYCSANEDAMVMAPLWGALTAAVYMGLQTGGVIFELIQGRILESSTELISSQKMWQPNAGTFLSVTGFPEHGYFELVSKGNCRFGLPEISMSNIPEKYASLAASVIRAYAQEMWCLMDHARVDDDRVRKFDLLETVSSRFFPTTFQLFGFEDDSPSQKFPISNKVVRQNLVGKRQIMLTPPPGFSDWGAWFGQFEEPLQSAERGIVASYDDSSVEAELDALETLPMVLQRHEQNQLSDCNVYFKCPFFPEDETLAEEFMWLMVQEIESSTFVGELQNAPIRCTSFQQGELLRVPIDVIVDWIIEHPNGTTEGNFTGAAC